MARYMLDTDISSYIMKRSHPKLLKKLRRVSPSDVCISVVTEAELRYGVELSPRRAQDDAALNAFVRHVEVRDFSRSAAGHYARIRAELKRSGRMIGANNLLIAAHARSLDLVLVTNNTSEFERVDALALENWSE